jgi:hypothetical protein
MNGRIERVDARYALNSEHNYSAVDFFFDEERWAKWKGRAKDAARLALLGGLITVILIGVNRAL